jgi:hypothetical protein
MENIHKLNPQRLQKMKGPHWKLVIQLYILSDFSKFIFLLQVTSKHYAMAKVEKQKCFRTDIFNSFGY